jgi:hypothetical protein
MAGGMPLRYGNKQVRRRLLYYITADVFQAAQACGTGVPSTHCGIPHIL